MTANVEQDEVEALLGGSNTDPGAEVHTRDFKRPRRLSVEDSASLEAALAIALPKASEEMSDVFGTPIKLELVSLAEVHADRIFEAASEPLAVLRFLASGHPGWVQWEILPAIQSIETLLGSTDTSQQPRPLSSIEGRVLEGILGAAIGPILEAFGTEPAVPAIVQEHIALGTWKDVEDGDPHRLAVEVAVEGLPKNSTLYFYLGGLTGTQASSPEGSESLPAALPKCLQEIEVDVCIFLEGGAFPLTQLLALEEGDVIRLDSRPGDPVELRIEDEPIGLADWGQSDGWSAIRLRREQITDK